MTYIITKVSFKFSKWTVKIEKNERTWESSASSAIARCIRNIHFRWFMPSSFQSLTVFFDSDRPPISDSTLILVILGGWNIIWNHWARINCLCRKYFCWNDRIATFDKTFHWWLDKIWNLLRHGFRIRINCWISSWCLYQNGVRIYLVVGDEAKMADIENGRQNLTKRMTKNILQNITFKSSDSMCYVSTGCFGNVKDVVSRNAKITVFWKK